MLRFAKFTENWRCFKKDDCILFQPGVNLLVGDQGCGKSSLIYALLAGGCPKSKLPNAAEMKKKIIVDASQSQLITFDFEKDNFRTKGYFEGNSTGFHIASMWKSHGEMVKALIGMLSQVTEHTVVIVDEPDTALSVKSIFLLEQTFKSLAEKGHQVVAAVHNPFLILAFDQVLSVEHSRWMSGREFIDLSISEYRAKKDEKNA